MGVTIWLAAKYGKYGESPHLDPVWTSDGRDQDLEVETETFIWVSWDRDKTFILSLMGSRLWLLCMESRETETFSRPTNFSLTRPIPVLRPEKSGYQERDQWFVLLKTINFDDIITETRTEIFTLSFMRSIPRLRLFRDHKFIVSRDRDCYQDQKSLGTETAHLWYGPCKDPVRSLYGPWRLQSLLLLKGPKVQMII